MTATNRSRTLQLFSTCLSAAVFVALLAVARNETRVMTPPPAAAANTTPLAFEENLGQADPRARFLLRAGNYTQFVTDREIVWRLRGASEHAVFLSFPGSVAARLQGGAVLAARSNYLKGGDPSKWISGARQFSSVSMSRLYPGVDLVLHGSRARPEYDFVVAPGADAGAIRLRFAGADSVRIGADGALSVRTAAGELLHHQPVAYQRDADGRTTWVRARFLQSAPDELRFALGAYDPARELVIDPVYEYSTYLGGSGGESLQGFSAQDPWQSIFVNGAGEVYAAGITNSTDFPTTAGSLQPAVAGDLDFYIAKLNAAGDAILFSTYVGGTRDEIGVGGIAVTGAGEILFAGTSQSNDFPTTVGAYDRTNGNASSAVGGDVVALKINAAGNALVYSTFLGSSANESLFGFAVDSAGRIVVAGQTVKGATEEFPVTAGVINTTGDQFITKLNSDGTGLAWSTNYGKPFGGEIRIRALALDSADNVYITGRTSATDFPATGGALDTTLGGGFDAFVARLAPDATGTTYATYLGGGGTDEGRAITVDAAGNAYVAGTSVGLPANDFPVTAGAFRTTPSNNGWGGFLAKLGPAGNNLAWATFLPPPNVSSNNPIALDATRRVYLANNGDNPAEVRVGESPESCIAHTASPGVMRISADGSSLEYGMRVGGSMVFTGGSDITANILNDLAVDANDNVYLIGSANSADFPTYHGAQPARAGSAPGTSDAYIAKLSDGAAFAMPTLAFSAANYAVAEDAGNATITINRTGRAAGSVRVRVTSSAGTATATTDYASIDQTVAWTNGDLTPKTINIPIVNDAVAEGAETVNLTLTKNWCLGDVGATSTAVLTINDAGAPPPPPPPPPVPGTLQLSAATYTAGEGVGNAAIVISRSGGSDGAVSVRLATSNGTATSGADYTATDVIVNFADGDAANQTVNVPILQDTTDEPDETITLTLSAPTGGATLGAASTATLTVTDDDPTPAPPPAPAPGGGGGGGLDVAMLIALLGFAAWRSRRNAR